MQILFLIVEYNPFHNGHSYHIKESKKRTGCDHVVVIMSGNFVQRGEPAILDKWKRTEAALKNGADLVLELPVYYATASAAFFAEAAVNIADSTGLPGVLCFGSECGDLEQLQKTARITLAEEDKYKTALRACLAIGRSFPAARASAIAAASTENETALIREPNNILAVEYLRALMKTNSKIRPYTIKRLSAHYHGTEIRAISSAGAIRSALRRHSVHAVQKTMPRSAYEILAAEMESGMAPADIGGFSAIYHYLLKTKPLHELQAVMDINEGLENRMLKTAALHYDIQDIMKALKTKRYTYTMLQRAILHLLLGITKNDFQYFQTAGGPQYVRVLGFKKEKSFLLHDIETGSSLPLLMNIKNAGRILGTPGIKMLAKEIEATDIYNLSRPKKNTLDKNQEYRQPIVIL